MKCLSVHSFCIVYVMHNEIDSPWIKCACQNEHVSGTSGGLYLWTGVLSLALMSDGSLMQTEKTDCGPHRDREDRLCSSDSHKEEWLCSPYDHKEEEGVQKIFEDKGAYII